MYTLQTDDVSQHTSTTNCNFDNKTKNRVFCVGHLGLHNIDITATTLMTATTGSIINSSNRNGVIAVTFLFRSSARADSLPKN